MLYCYLKKLPFNEIDGKDDKIIESFVYDKKNLTKLREMFFLLTEHYESCLRTAVKTFTSNEVSQILKQ